MALKVMRKHLVSAAIDVAIPAGALLVAYGAWLVYEPAGYIAGGALLLAGGIAGARA